VARRNKEAMMGRYTMPRWVPEGATAVEGEGVVVYCYTMRNGKPAAVCYGGKRSKADYHYSYPTEEARDKRVQETLDAYAASAARKKAAREAKKNQPNPFKVGDVLVCSWGYDQTNVDFYVVQRTTKSMVEMVKCGSKSVQAHGPMSDAVVPDPEKTFGNPLKKRVQGYMDGGEFRAYVTMNSFSSARKWEGRPSYRSWYA